MGLNFNLYEVEDIDLSLNDEYDLKRVLSLNDVTAMFITEWFYNMNGRLLHNNINEPNYFIKCTGVDLLKLKDVLNQITDSVGAKRNSLALNYFPTTYINSYYVGNLEIFSDEYYECLFEIIDGLNGFISSDSVHNRERVFFYNVSW